MTQTHDFDDLLAANRRAAETSDDHRRSGGFAGIADAGVGIVTCMDSRIDPLGLLGLQLGDAKILRNLGGRVTPNVLDALILAVHVLGVRRILVVAHTRCAMVLNTEQQLRDRVSESSGLDASSQHFAVVSDQRAALHADVARVRGHPLVPAVVLVGGFVYDVDTGLLAQEC